MEKHIREAFNDEILKKAVCFYNVDADSVKSLGGFESFIYEFKIKGKDFILRITHSDHRVVKMVEAELEWVNYLAENNANVSEPIKSINDRLIEVVDLDDNKYFIVSAYHKAKGGPPSKENTIPTFYQDYGQAIGKLHRLTKDFNPKIKRFEWYEESLFVEGAKFIPKDQQIIKDKFIETIDKIKQLPKDEDSYGLIHTDIHMGNFFVDKGNITIFDFDDCSYKHFISDIAIVIFYYIAFSPNKTESEKSEFAQEFLIEFFKGYNKENKLNKREIENLPIFLKLREIILYIIIYSSFDIDDLPKWASWYLGFFKERIENDIETIKIDLKNFY